MNAKKLIDRRVREGEDGSAAILYHYYHRPKVQEGLAEVIRRIAEEFYVLPLDISLQDILSKIRKGDKPSTTWDVMLSPEEVWPFREFTRTKGNNRHTPEEWEDMKAKMKETGWDTRNPLALMVSEKGEATVIDGNHRLSLAKECGLEKIPVKLSFVQDLKKASRA